MWRQRFLLAALSRAKRGFPKIRGTFLGVPIIRTIVFWGLYWGPPFLGNYQILSIAHVAICFRLISCLEQIGAAPCGPGPMHWRKSTVNVRARLQT